MYSPKFPAGQTRAERVQLIRETIDPKEHSAEELESEISCLFAHWNSVPVLKREAFDENFSRKIGRHIRPFVVYDAGEHAFGAEPGQPARMHSQRISGPTISCGLLADLLETISIQKRCAISITPELITSFREERKHRTDLSVFR
jgi:hypothetical protein